MIEQFEGLDRWIPRQVRGDLLNLLNVGAIAIERLELADAAPRDPIAQEALHRWNDTSPLRRAAAAVLGYLEDTDRDLTTTELHGKPLVWDREKAPELAVGFEWRHFNQLPFHFETGQDWIEVVRPTRTQPLHALHITVRDRAALHRAHQSR